jgi:hypothetical protein
MNSSASVELRYEKCLLIWGNARFGGMPEKLKNQGKSLTYEALM